MFKNFLGIVLFCSILFCTVSNSYSWVLDINNVHSYISYLHNLDSLKKPKVVNKKLVNKGTTIKVGKLAKSKAVIMSVVSSPKVKSVSYLKLKMGSSIKSVPVIKKYVLRKIKKPIIMYASINGSSNGLPVIFMSFKNKPLWQVLQYVSNKTGYVFKVKHINLAKNVTISGRYNLANFLAYIFNGKSDKTTLNVRSKKVIVER